jgi:hypothetical protein
MPIVRKGSLGGWRRCSPRRRSSARSRLFWEVPSVQSEHAMARSRNKLTKVDLVIDIDDDGEQVRTDLNLDLRRIL